MNIFDNKDTKVGFRLNYVELLNWGTFHNKVYKIVPNGETTALFGINGSGKTTLVHALLTLLVPKKYRAYNLAYGKEERKKGRSDETYFYGYFGEKVDEDNEKILKKEKLRTDKDYAILLACFENESEKKKITLAQIHYVVSGKMKVVYVISPQFLTIKEHFSQLNLDPQETRTLTTTLKKLCQTDYVFVDDFGKYLSIFSEEFGIQSDKALLLFNKIIDMKEITDLNAFVRNEMLDDEIRELAYQELGKIETAYQNLLSLKNQIDTAEEQLKMLMPIVSKIEEFRLLQTNSEHFEEIGKQIPYFFAEKKEVILAAQIAENTKLLQEIETELAEITSKIKEVEEEISNLRITLANNQVAQQIKELQIKINELTENIKTKDREFAAYKILAEKLEFNENPETELDFQNSFAQANQHIIESNDKIKEIDEQLINQKSDLKPLKENQAKLLAEIAECINKPSNIPTENRKKRVEIAEMLGVKETDLPFIGELIMVEENEKLWEGAIERLLRSFAMNMLVSEEYALQVHKFVNDKNNKGLITYKKVAQKTSSLNFRQPLSNGVVEKLELKNSDRFGNWLLDELKKDFDYQCFENPDENYNAYKGKAITKNGLIKSNETSFRKDDRFAIDNRSNYVLGWDSFQKVETLREMAREQQKNIAKIEEQINTNTNQKRKLEDLIKLCNNFVKFDSFSTIDSKTDVLKKQENMALKTKLESSEEAQQTELLRKSLEDKIKDLEEKRKTESELQNKKGKTESKEEVLKRENESNKQVLEDCLATEIANDKFAMIAQQVVLKNMVQAKNLAEITKEEKIIQEYFTTALDKAKEAKNNLRVDLEKCMFSFLNKFVEFKVEMTDKTDANNLEQFIALKAKIETQELSVWKAKFNHLQEGETTALFANFKQELDEKLLKSIKDDLKKINNVLKKIPFSSISYIQIKTIELYKDGDVQIAKFYADLKEIITSSLGMQSNDLQIANRFVKIKALFDAFKENDAWKKKVIDVRNWLKFRIQEFDNQDDRELRTFESSDGFSGGQKARCAYAIMAAALAYKAGFDYESVNSSKSFRFVVIDEVFSKIDTESPALIMQLFKDLNLQLLVVIPDRDRLNYIHDYIKKVHYVANNERRNHSTVNDITIDKIYELNEL
jgi:uncharacterized protein YPO0396